MQLYVTSSVASFPCTNYAMMAILVLPFRFHDETGFCANPLRAI